MYYDLVKRLDQMVRIMTSAKKEGNMKVWESDILNLKEAIAVLNTRSYTPSEERAVEYLLTFELYDPYQGEDPIGYLINEHVRIKEKTKTLRKN